MTEETAVAVAAESTEQVAEETLKPGSDGTAADQAPAEEVETQKSEADGKEDSKSTRGELRRINELSRKNAVLEATAEYWRKKALGEATEEDKRATEKPKAEEAKPKPNPDDYGTTADYLEALADYKADEKLRAYEAKQMEKSQAEQQKAQQAAAQEEWKKKAVPFVEKNADYPDVIKEAYANIGKLPDQLADAIGGAILDSDMGPALLYQLGDAELVKEFEGLSPYKAIKKLGEIEARLAGETGDGEKPPPQTRAPKPPTPIKKIGAVGAPFDPLDPKSYADYATYEREMNKRELAARKSGG